MFAPKPFDVAKEMVRVTKPGGQIVMGNWIPNDPTFVSQLLRISSAFTPPPPEGFVSPMTWGVESHIIERFGHAGVPKEDISMVTDTYYFAHSEKSPTEFIELFEKFYGPTMNAVDAARRDGQRRRTAQAACGTGKCSEREQRARSSLPPSCESLLTSRSNVRRFQECQYCIPIPLSILHPRRLCKLRQNSLLM